MKELLSAIILAIAGLCFAACGGPAQPTANSDAKPANAANAKTETAKPAAPTVESLMAIEKKSWDDWAKKDAKGLEPYMAATFTEVSRGGISDRAAAIKGWTEHKCEMKSVKFSDEKIDQIAEGVALLTYKATAEITCEGKAGPSPTYTSALYVKEGDTWKSTYFQEVPAVDAKGEYPPVAAPAAKKEEAAKPEAGNEEIVAMETKLWETWKARDQKAFEEILSEKFVGNGGNGRSDRATMLKNSFDEKCKVDSFALSGFKVVNVSKDVKMIAYKATQKGACGKDAFKSPVMATGFYVNENGKWKSVYYMETPGV